MRSGSGDEGGPEDTFLPGWQAENVKYSINLTIVLKILKLILNIPFQSSLTLLENVMANSPDTLHDFGKTTRKFLM